MELGGGPMTAQDRCRQLIQLAAMPDPSCAAFRRTPTDQERSALDGLFNAENILQRIQQWMDSLCAEGHARQYMCWLRGEAVPRPWEPLPPHLSAMVADSGISDEEFRWMYFYRAAPAWGVLLKNDHAVRHAICDAVESMRHNVLPDHIARAISRSRGIPYDYLEVPEKFSLSAVLKDDPAVRGTPWERVSPPNRTIELPGILFGESLIDFRLEPAESGYRLALRFSFCDGQVFYARAPEWLIPSEPRLTTEPSNEKGEIMTNADKSHVGRATELPGLAIRTANRFRIALSFPGERRQIVQQVAERLAASLGQEHVLYDVYHEAEFARPNLDTHLQRLYHDESELIVVFLCAHYEQKEWCGLEWRAIRDLIKKRKDQSVMLLRFDDSDIPGVFSTDGYIWIGERSPEEIGELVLQRLEISRGKRDLSIAPTKAVSSDLEQTLRKHPRVAPLLRHKRDQNAADAAVLYFCRGADNPAERKNPTKTWQLVEQAYTELRRQTDSQ
jgi:hypothetical protein